MIRTLQFIIKGNCKSKHQTYFIVRFGKSDIKVATRITIKMVLRHLKATCSFDNKIQFILNQMKNFDRIQDNFPIPQVEQIIGKLKKSKARSLGGCGGVFDKGEWDLESARCGVSMTSCVPWGGLTLKRSTPNICCLLSSITEVRVKRYLPVSTMTSMRSMLLAKASLRLIWWKETMLPSRFARSRASRLLSAFSRLIWFL